MSILRTNSLYLAGDFVIIKVSPPIIPSETIVLGYFIHSEDIIDNSDIILGKYSLSSVNSVVDEDSLIWKTLINISPSADIDTLFLADCNTQVDPYYIYFKFIKPVSTSSIVNIDKVSLQIASKQNSDGTYGDYSKYPYYSKSIFGLNSLLYSSENTNWAYNVLEKLKGHGILPTFIEKDKDFNIFWGWLTHWYGVIVNFARQFLDIFSQPQMFFEFLKQKNYYLNSKLSVFENIKSTQNGQFFLFQYDNFSLNSSGSLIKNQNWITTEKLSTKINSKYILKSVPNVSLNETYLLIEDVYYYSFDINETLIDSGVLSISYNNFLEDFIISNPNICFVRFSYIKTKNCLIEYYFYGENFYKAKSNSKNDLLSVYNIFNKRGSVRETKELISEILESTPLDNLICQYIPKNNLPWVLGKSSPLNRTLLEPIKLGDLQINETISFVNGNYCSFKENKFLLNECLSLSFEKKTYQSCIISFLFYDENNEIISDALFLEKSEIRGLYSSNKGNIVIQNIPTTNLTNVKIFLNSVRDIDLLNHKEYSYPTQPSSYNFCVHKLVKYVQIESIFVSNLPNPFALDPIGLGNSLPEYNFIKEFLAGVNIYGKNSSNELYIYSYTINIINNNLINLVFGERSNEVITTNPNFKGSWDFYQLYLENDIVNFHNIYYIGSSIVTNEKRPDLFPTYWSVLGTDTLTEVNIENLSFDSFDKGLFYIKTAEGEFLFNFPSLYKGSFLDNFSHSLEENTGLLLYPTLNLNPFKLYIILNKLPYNLCFLNSPKYYLIYGENNSNYSDKKIQNIISQKILPYSNFNLFLSSSDIKVKEILFQISDFILTPSHYYLSSNGTIYVSWYGGKATYTLSIYEIIEDLEYIQVGTSIIIQDTEYTFTGLNGIYKIIIEDGEGNLIIKDKISLLAPNQISANFKIQRYPGLLSEIQALNTLNVYNKVYISVKGGISPYELTYLSVTGEKKISISYPNDIILIEGFIYPINQIPSTLSIKDKVGTVEIIQIEKDQILYIDLSTIGEGSCILNQ